MWYKEGVESPAVKRFALQEGSDEVAEPLIAALKRCDMLDFSFFVSQTCKHNEQSVRRNSLLGCGAISLMFQALFRAMFSQFSSSTNLVVYCIYDYNDFYLFQNQTLHRSEGLYRTDKTKY